MFTPFQKLPYTYPYGRSVDETTTLAPEFWGSWSDSWLKTDLLACRTYIV
jgi:hypothetical protein